MPEVAGRTADAFEASVREHEERWLSPLAVRSFETRGCAREEEPCLLRTPFQRDRDRIVHTKSFRRLMHKTQVFVDPAGDHFRTRLTHTLETTGISRGVARALRLNEDLVEAIGLGHDLGHTPFGHAGEEALDGLVQQHGRRFRHNEHSLRVVDVLERDGRGLNLTAEVRDGILTHTGPNEPDTL
jgi:dGTPase